MIFLISITILTRAEPWAKASNIYLEHFNVCFIIFWGKSFYRYVGHFWNGQKSARLTVTLRYIYTDVDMCIYVYKFSQEVFTSDVQSVRTDSIFHHYLQHSYQINLQIDQSQDATKKHTNKTNNIEIGVFNRTYF